MIFIKSYKQTHNKCSHCGLINHKDKSEIIVIEVHAFTKVITICHVCQKKKPFLSAEFNIEEFKDIKLEDN